MKSKKAQTLGIAIIVSITLFLIGILFINFLTGEVTRTRDSNNLDCANTDNISDGTKLTCLVVNVIVPYFVLLIFSVAGGVITARFLV